VTGLPATHPPSYTRSPEGTHPSRGTTLSLEREYDEQLSHTIWELERSVRRGGASETLRRSLIEAHAQHLRHLEDIAEIPRPQRSQLLLQGRPTEALLLLPGEGAGCDELQGLADSLYKRGFTVLASNLAYRVLDQPLHSPQYWQTCADEAQHRYDILTHYSTRVGVIGVGMSALVALHLASVRRVSEVVALFPTLGSEAGWVERLRATFRRLVLRDARMPRGWAHQRQLAARAAREQTGRLTVPLYVVVEDRSDRSEAGRSASIAHKLASRAATRVKVVPAGTTARDLPAAVQDDILSFLRRR
jgi:esterase/lipase